MLMALAVNPRGLPPSISQKQSHANSATRHFSPTTLYSELSWGDGLGSNDLTTSQNCHMPITITGQPGTSPFSPGWFSNVFMAFPSSAVAHSVEKVGSTRRKLSPGPPHRAPSTRRVICAAWQEKLKSRATTCSPKKLRGCSEGAGPRVGKALAPCKRGLALATLLDCPHYAHDNANKNHSVDQ